MTAFNDSVIAAFRTDDGRVRGWGDRLVLIHHRGAKTGRDLVNPAMSLRDGTDWLVVGSKMGAPSDPQWVVDLRARPAVEIEAVVQGHLAVVPVTATELGGAERDRAWRMVTEAVPSFAAYQAKSGRLLPVIRLRPRLEPGTQAADEGAEDAMAPDDPSRSLAIRRPDTDSTLPHVGVAGDTYTILLTGNDTDGRYGLIDMHVPPGGGPPLHRHDFEEMFHILEGEIAFTFRGETVTARVGETVNIPARAPHRFKNVSNATARMLAMVTPPGLEEFFSIWGEPLPDRTSAPNPEQTAERLGRSVPLAHRYRIENL